MKIIFLELHGVLMLPVCDMVARIQQQPKTAYKPAVDALNMIVSETHAEIIITSSWGNAGDEPMKQMFDKWGIKAKIREHTLPTASCKEEGISRMLIWMAIPESYVIIDCDEIGNTQYAPLSTFSVRTDPEFGLTESLGRKAIEILNRSK